jgi:hypothetical protein
VVTGVTFVAFPPSGTITGPINALSWGLSTAFWLTWNTTTQTWQTRNYLGGIGIGRVYSPQLQTVQATGSSGARLAVITALSNGKSIFSMNFTSGQLTALFSQDSASPVRTTKWNISYVSSPLPTVFRYPCGAVYGTATKVSGAFVDIDVSRYSLSLTSPWFMPPRPVDTMLANGFIYNIGL